MILKTLYIKIGDRDLPIPYTYGFKKKSRYICNYIEREVLKKLRYKVEGYNRIVIGMKTELSGDLSLIHI